MPNKRRTSWGEGQVYEALCLLMISACCWMIGVQLAVFQSLDNLIVKNGLSDVFMLGFFMGLAMVVVNIRKSLKLRTAMMERDAAATAAEATARHDALTGLANRRLFLESVEKRRGQTGASVSSAVLLIDLDRFKPVNDLYGHAAGNSVLCAVAERLEALLPSQDIAARLGGDEFAMLVGMEGGSDEIVRLAQQVIASISDPVLWDQHELKVGATVGVAFVTADHANSEAVLHAADLAMYQGKKSGRGTYCVFKSAMDQELRTRALLETELRFAIENGEIKPFYQPVVMLPSKEMIGVEVLARWHHPTHGLLSPTEFISVAEETGMIGDLSSSLIRQACLDAKTWPPHLTLAINISPQQFQDPWLSERILAILTDTGFPPSRLEVEITESALIHNLDATRSILASLRSLGVRIALDDFGTGYSSLYHLRELRFDKLKIDRSYVDTITMSDERAKLVDAIIKLGSSLGLVTTAEGIETEDSVTWLSEQGCGFGQGYLFGAPMAKQDFDSLLGMRSAHEAAPEADPLAA